MIIIFMIFIIIISSCIILRKIFSSRVKLNNAKLFDIAFIKEFDIAFTSADEDKLSSIAQCSAELPAIFEACKVSIAQDQ